MFSTEGTNNKNNNNNEYDQVNEPTIFLPSGVVHTKPKPNLTLKLTTISLPRILRHKLLKHSLTANMRRGVQRQIF